MRVDVERLRMEIDLPQPEPPQQSYLSPRRLPGVDTGSEEAGTPRRSPAIGTASDEPGVSRGETQSTEREEIISLQANVDVLFALQLHKPGAGVHSVSTRRRGRRQRRSNNFKSTSRRSQGVCWTADWPATTRDASTEQSKQFDPGCQQ